MLNGIGIRAGGVSLINKNLLTLRALTLKFSKEIVYKALSHIITLRTSS